MKFNTSIIEYKGNNSWVEDALRDAKQILHTQVCPEHSPRCDVGRFLKEAAQAVVSIN